MPVRTPVETRLACRPAGNLLHRHNSRGGRMPPRGVKKGTKLARQYEHIKDSERKQGRSLSRAKEIAARTKGRTREQLYNEARKMNIEGRSSMNKAQLQRAVDSRKR